MQHHNLIHKQRSKTYSWSCHLEARLFFIMLLRWSIFLFLLVTVNFSGIYSQSGNGDLWRKRESTTIWVSHSYPFLIACLPSSPSWFPCFYLASFPFRLSESIFTTRKCYTKINFSYNEINKCNRFSNFHTSLISNMNAFVSAIYILIVL